MGEVTVAPASTSIPSQTARKKVTSNIDRLLKLKGFESGNKRENEGGNIDDALPLPLDSLVLFTHSKPCEKRTYDAGEPIYTCTYVATAKPSLESRFFLAQKRESDTYSVARSFVQSEVEKEERERKGT